MLFPPLISLGRTSRTKLNWKRNSRHMFPVTRRKTFTSTGEHWSPTFLAPGTGFVEDNFSTDRGGWWFQDDSKWKWVFTHSCLTLCDPMDCSLPGSSVHGILQVRILGWIAIPFSRRSSQPRDQIQVSRVAGRFFTVWATRDDSSSLHLLCTLFLLLLHQLHLKHQALDPGGWEPLP